MNIIINEASSSISVTEDTQFKKRKPNRKKKVYHRLDITGLEDYLNQAIAREILKQGKQISRTKFIRGLIEADKIKNS